MSDPTREAYPVYPGQTGIGRRHEAWRSAEFDGVEEHPDTQCSADVDRGALIDWIAEARKAIDDLPGMTAPDAGGQWHSWKAWDQVDAIFRRCPPSKETPHEALRQALAVAGSTEPDRSRLFLNALQHRGYTVVAISTTPLGGPFRSIVERTASMGSCSQTHHEYLSRDARAAVDAVRWPPSGAVKEARDPRPYGNDRDDSEW